MIFTTYHGGIMIAENRFIYKIELSSASAIFDFVKSANKLSYDVMLVNGKHKLNAKSYLGVLLAKVSWDEIYIESDTDCYFDFEKYIV